MAPAARVLGMAPDRGLTPPRASDSSSEDDGAYPSALGDQQEGAPILDRGLPVAGRSFTFRGVAVGLLVGLVICFSNMYFGLQTGWVSTMTMPASLMGFGIFKTLSRRLEFPFSPVENVLVQTVAGSMAIMPLGCGFVGVVSSPTTEVFDPDSGFADRWVDPRHELFASTRGARTSAAQPLEVDCLVSGTLLFRRCLCRSLVRFRIPNVLHSTLYPKI